MASVLNDYDQALHDFLHAEMLDSDPSKLLLNPRTQIVDLASTVTEAPYGAVADVGCGSGYLSIYIAKNFSQVRSIDAIEASKLAVDKVIPRNTSFHGVANKITPKLGSFDILEPEKYDFIFAMGALHHSHCLETTLLSISNGLKKGGFLIAQEPAMPDSTTHEQYEFKYNIVEEKFGLKIRNGDRYDRFFRECEYKAALVKSGFDIILWADFSKNKEGTGSIRTLARRAFESFEKSGLIGTAKKTISQNRKLLFPRAELAGWKKDMNHATRAVKPKALVAKKTTIDRYYHNE